MHLNCLALLVTNVDNKFLTFNKGENRLAFRGRSASLFTLEQVKTGSFLLIKHQ
jgi:hypothetical protein